MNFSISECRRMVLVSNTRGPQREWLWCPQRECFWCPTTPEDRLWEEADPKSPSRWATKAARLSRPTVWRLILGRQTSGRHLDLVAVRDGDLAFGPLSLCQMST